MSEIVKLTKAHTTAYQAYLQKCYYENLYLNLDFSQELINNPREKKSGHFYGFIKENDLKGVFVFANNGILHASFIDDEVLKKVDLLRALKHYKPKIIKGKKDVIDKIVYLVERSISKYQSNEFYIMEYNGDGFACDSSDLLTEEVVTHSFDFLVTVEKSFNRNPRLLNDTRTKILLKAKKDEYFCYIRENSIVAQGMLENQGTESIVLGSIYTEKKHRHQGFGSKIVKNLVNTVLKKKKKPILLVKKSNVKAIRLYESLDFTKQSDFEIVEVKIK